MFSVLLVALFSTTHGSMNGGATTTHIDAVEKLELLLLCLTTHFRFAQMGGILTLKKALGKNVFKLVGSKIMSIKPNPEEGRINDRSN